MTEKESNKKVPIAHARKGPDFYLKVFRHQITGHSPTNIAKWLTVPAITVRRTMNKFRDPLLGHQPITDYLRELAYEVRVHHLFVLFDLEEWLWDLFYGTDGLSIFDFHNCFVNCNFKKTPQMFRKDILQYHNFQRPDYCFTFPIELEEFDISVYLEKCHECRYCPLKHTQHGIHNLYRNDVQVYVDLKYHLSNFRLKKEYDELELINLYREGLRISLIQSILRTKLGKLQFEKDNDEEAENALEEFFLEISTKMFNMMDSFPKDKSPQGS